MTQDNWQDCPTFQSVAAALDRGDEFQRWDGCDWVIWGGTYWSRDMRIRCRPAKKTKTVLMCKALFVGSQGHTSYDVQVGTEEQYGRCFMQWIGEPYEVEVPHE